MVAARLIDRRQPFSSNHVLTAVSCPEVSLCVAADNEGEILTSRDPRAGAAARWTITQVRSRLRPRRAWPPDPRSASFAGSHRDSHGVRYSQSARRKDQYKVSDPTTIRALENQKPQCVAKPG